MTDDDTVTMIPLSSSNIESAGFDKDRKILFIKFHGDRTYQYSGIPESIFRGLLAAESAGRYFRSHIRGVYTSANVSSGAPV